MQPFDYIEKLINEHGSAKILRQQLSLFQQQHVAFEHEILDLKAKNADLQAQLEVVKTERDKANAKAETLQTELEDARKQIKEYEDGNPLFWSSESGLRRDV